MPEYSESTVHMQAPEAAVPLPVHGPVDLDAWAVDAARLRAGRDDDARLIEALAVELGEAAADARGRVPIVALSYVPEPRLGELARIELSPLVADETYPAVTVDLLHRYLAMPTDLSFRPPEAERRTLPAGPAVRVRHAYVQEPDRDGTGTILETCAYGICPDKKWGLVLLTSWRALAHTDTLCALTDSLAETITVTSAR
ncbi:hypothetical protein ACFYW8_29285 [Streptomyces sp. NPDC002742]|uniref:hypothetical protein n=1 Tax=Streptomyces sp. NPDC002742 TaxID=3364663 RepID=UPI0036BB28BE